MKVNEILGEGILGSIGRGLGNVATGAVRTLDRMAGGDGSTVGTASQQARYAADQTEKNRRLALAELPKRAAGLFAAELQKSGININDPRTFNTDEVKQKLQRYAATFFSDGESTENAQYIVQSIVYQPIPMQINKSSIEDYFRKVAIIKDNAEQYALQNQARQNQARQNQAHTQTAQATAVPRGLTNGVEVVSSSSPLVLRFRNRDYALTNNDQWVLFGSNRSPSAEMVEFLNQQLQRL